MTFPKILAPLAVLLLSGSAAMAEVTLINVFEVPPGQRDAAVAAWETARDFLQEQPGYISTALHGSLDPQARFSLINIAHWESPAHFADAIAAMRAAGAFPPVEGVVPNAALYEVVRAE
ncbi:antibiotic biosynthesis monooxygenase family protein [Salipiger abyssi]|uniref:antibiotic biosynthesis monooxygenase family protein n=1 Tax=Salipiger abyssi TaxID=1250539 RepID=UPI001A8CCA94|nr:antibiotic biosynthesis monooxygenase family protein [Salipiger abyssi]MBN9887545.1 antibiotic biosynthesis monooxygenase [Salipiger abyssi]